MTALLLSVFAFTGLQVPAALAPPTSSKPAAATPSPQVIKFRELVNRLRGWRGQVVVVDFWADG
jgi:thiol:disulfide interchange protein